MAGPYIITIASEKGGVGKTTLATNLAIYLKGLAEDLPITLLSFDNHFTVDRMFQLGKPTPDRHVGQLFNGIRADELTQMGQYGVGYIPSNSNLYEEQQQIQGNDSLAAAINRSNLSGILIIDTSPVLDNYTCNALFAADRIIVPIKDAPSLENCRHLSDFLTRNQRSKSLLKILPCMIDTRIRFEGPFRNSYHLLKAFAINRGYRCYEGFISKSPKVETLSTNPSGRIFPVITHARSTEVHLQLSHLARQVYIEYLDSGPARLQEVATRHEEEDARQRHLYRERVARLEPGCFCCGTPLQTEEIWPNAFYLEDAATSRCGFVEGNCLLKMLQEDFYPELNGNRQLLQEFLSGPVTSGYLLLRERKAGPGMGMYDLYLLDREGERISGRSIEISKTTSDVTDAKTMSIPELFSGLVAPETEGHRLVLMGYGGKKPAELLKNQNYLKWQKVFDRVRIEEIEEQSELSPTRLA
ncbi:MAG: ParA family protein [Desulfuromonas sp.]|nr:MAG: ParA family protein [Desulfuromonas sp.]